MRAISPFASTSPGPRLEKHPPHAAAWSGSAYLDELAQVRGMLDNRYDHIKSGKVKLIDGEEAFDRSRQKNEARRNDRA